MRISDWSSDVCSSDLCCHDNRLGDCGGGGQPLAGRSLFGSGSLSACGPGRIGADRAMELDDRKSRTGACPMTIQLYTWSTPNGRKISILLEELGVPYEVHTIDITKDEQFSQDFLAINPNNKIPAIIDPDGPGDATFTLFESGAILIYLAKKHQSPLWPDDPLLQARVLQWLMRSEEHTSELQQLMRISYAVFCLKQKNSRSHHQPIQAS